MHIVKVVCPAAYTEASNMVMGVATSWVASPLLSVCGKLFHSRADALLDERVQQALDLARVVGAFTDRLGGLLEERFGV